MKRSHSILLVLSALSFILILTERSSFATPLFSMQAAERCDTCHEMPDRTNPRWVEENYKLSERKCTLNCSVCHENPTGGMLRTAPGFYYGTKSLPWSSYNISDFNDDLRTIKNNRFLSIGGDFRLLLLRKEEDDYEKLLIFPMQADLYAKANLLKHVSFMSQFGLERGGNSAVREVFGLIEDIPFNAYIKAGKFLPPYGHRLDDHTAFIRTKIAFDHSQPEAYVSGYEIGADPLLVFARFSQFNRDVTPAQDSDSTPRGVSGELGWRGLWLHLGVSYINIEDFETTSVSTTDRSAYGYFGAIRLWRLTYLFEQDFRRDSIRSGGGERDEDSVISFNEINLKLIRGLNIKLRYEMFDPDEDSSEEEEERYVMGIDLYPYPFTELNMQYRIKEEDSDIDNNQVLLVAHLWF